MQMSGRVNNDKGQKKKKKQIIIVSFEKTWAFLVFGQLKVFHRRPKKCLL